MQAHEEHSHTDERLRRQLNAAVNRLMLETVAMEDQVRAALNATFARAVSEDCLRFHSEAEVNRTYAVRVQDKRSAGVLEKGGRRVLAFCVSELTMDSLRDAAGALFQVDGHQIADAMVLTMLTRHLLAVRRLDAELDAEKGGLSTAMASSGRNS